MTKQGKTRQDKTLPFERQNQKRGLRAFVFRREGGGGVKGKETENKTRQDKIRQDKATQGAQGTEEGGGRREEGGGRREEGGGRR